MVALYAVICQDANGQGVGGGQLRAQVEQIVRNIVTALSSVGVTADDVVRTVIYVVSPNRDDLAQIWTILWNSTIASALSTASTLLSGTACGNRRDGDSAWLTNLREQPGLLQQALEDCQSGKSSDFPTLEVISEDEVV